ncbi:hypothetical protein ACH3WN_13350 [Streptomyces albogriseolus]|uniref:hypothetical protein n=1 Tax=Streptomyces albogriseolus TaxID=1887 RepID=UPI0037963A19
MGSSINVHITPRLGSRNLNSVTPIVVERFLDELETDGVGRGNQVNIFRVLKAILRDAYGKGAMADDPVRGVQVGGLRLAERGSSGRERQQRCGG